MPKVSENLAVRAILERMLEEGRHAEVEKLRRQITIWEDDPMALSPEFARVVLEAHGLKPLTFH